ncbi:pantetheine-phosphate adenylyltransferase [Clostridium fallax]|uniref:Phosphopantetheine adenylyltransferase n=1 Tax=Clostridium fallax TaxID=1533 RepID=A0A1M4UV17_9CLOT|nr:pantetheine-phosphate adenylyltransferase [Clostridium fallax]SHE60528.1 Phosphopantetheine adenylyltransferase [Clostridium fallax]SQB06876.1 phosphopantetheine adenylyltransferase [Clostridium fallax]
MKIAVYPGSFDPITNGHLDIIKRGAKAFDKVIVAVMVNIDKKGLFHYEERVDLIKKLIKGLENVTVESHSGLLIDLMRDKNATIILKGLRSVADFEYEMQMALINKKLDPKIDTVFMMTNTEYSYISSSAVKQIAKFGGSIEGLVPEEIIPDVISKIKSQ